MNKEIKNKYIIKRYCPKEFHALSVLEEVGITSDEVYKGILTLARQRNKNFSLEDEVYRQNYYNSLRIRRNYPQIRGIVKHVYTKYGCIPMSFARIYRNSNGQIHIKLDTFLRLFK